MCPVEVLYTCLWDVTIYLHVAFSVRNYNWSCGDRYTFHPSIRSFVSFWRASDRVVYTLDLISICALCCTEVKRSATISHGRLTSISKWNRYSLLTVAIACIACFKVFLPSIGPRGSLLEVFDGHYFHLHALQTLKITCRRLQISAIKLFEGVSFQERFAARSDGGVMETNAFRTCNTRW